MNIKEQLSEITQDGKKILIFIVFPALFIVVGSAFTIKNIKSDSPVNQEQTIVKNDINNQLYVPDSDSSTHQSKSEALENKTIDQMKKDMLKNQQLVKDDDFYEITFDTKGDTVYVVKQDIKEQGLYSEDMQKKIDALNGASNVQPSTSINIAPKETLVKEIVYVEKQPVNTLAVSLPIDNKKRRVVGGEFGNMGTGYNNGKFISSDNIKAVVHNSNHSVESGSEVTIRVTEDCYVNGALIPANTLITSYASMNNERVKLKVTTISVQGSIYSVAMSAYSTDGIEGVHVKQNINDEIAQDGTKKTVNEGSTKINIPILGSISTNAVNKKMNDKSPILKDGTIIILKPKKQ